MFCTKDVLRNLAKFTGKHLCRNLFLNKVEDLGLATLLKKRLRHRCFPVDSANWRDHLEISESTSWQRHWHRHRHSIYEYLFFAKHKLLEIKVTSIYLFSMHSTAGNMYSCNVPWQYLILLKPSTFDYLPISEMYRSGEKYWT